MLCTDATLIRSDPSGSTAEPLRCRRWTCSHCRSYRLKLLKKLAGSGEPDLFITLTVNPEVGSGPADRARLLMQTWRRCRRAAIKRFKLKSLSFLAVFEKTKKGEPHLHLLCRSGYIPQGWLSEFMKTHLNSPIVDIRRIRSKRQAINYVAKYVGKDPHQFEGLKRYWRSQDYVICPEDIKKPETIPGVYYDVVFMDWYTFLHCQARWGQLGAYNDRKAHLCRAGPL